MNRGYIFRIACNIKKRNENTNSISINKINLRCLASSTTQSILTPRQRQQSAAFANKWLAERNFPMSVQYQLAETIEDGESLPRRGLFASRDLPKEVSVLKELPLVALPLQLCGPAFLQNQTSRSRIKDHKNASAVTGIHEEECATRHSNLSLSSAEDNRFCCNCLKNISSDALQFPSQNIILLRTSPPPGLLTDPSVIKLSQHTVE